MKGVHIYIISYIVLFTYNILTSITATLAVVNFTRKSNTFKEKCVVTLANQNEDIVYEKFYYLQDSCIYVSSNKNVVQNNHADILIEIIWKLGIQNCTIITAIDDRLQNVLSILFKETHVLTPYSYNSASKHLRSERPAQVTCSIDKHIYIDAIAMLTEHITVELVSIIVEDNNCELEFANSLADEIRKRRKKHHSLMFVARVYKIKFNTPYNILQSIQSELVNKRAFVMLTSADITSSFFQASADIKMNQYSEIWIVKHAKKYINIPPQTMTFSVKTFSEYQPMYGGVTENELMGARKSFKAICPISVDDTSLLKMMWQYAYLNETKEKITIRLRRENSWNILYEVEEKKKVFSMLYQKFVFLGALGIDHLPRLKIVSVIEGPFLFIEDYKNGKCKKESMICQVSIKLGNETKWKNTCCYGYSVDLIIHLQHLLGFQSDLYIVEDNKYGKYIGGLKLLNGMIADVYNHKAAMAVAGLTINTDRSRYIDFTEPFMRAEIGIVTLEIDKQFTIYLNLDFIANLESQIIYTMIATFLLAIICLYSFDNVILSIKRAYDKKFRGYSDVKMYSWLESFNYMSGLMFQRGIGRAYPSTKGGRTISVFFAFAMVSFTSLYTASLTADRVAVKETEFRGLNDERMVRPTDKFKFATSKDTSMESFFKNAPDEHFNRIYRFMLKYNVNGLLEGIQKVMNGELQAYLNEYPFLKYYIAKHSDCKLEIHENSVGQSSYGIAVAKDSYIKSALSQAILTLTEQEVLLRLEEKWLSNDCNVDEKDNRFSLYYFATPLLMLAGYIILCFFILIGEIIKWKYFTSKRRTLRRRASVRLRAICKQETNKKESIC